MSDCIDRKGKIGGSKTYEKEIENDSKREGVWSVRAGTDNCKK